MTTTTAADVVDRHRDAIILALARDASCISPSCSSAAGLRRRANAVARVVAPLDDALAEIHSISAKGPRVAPSVLRHAARELISCLQLSAAKQGGAPELADCSGPVARFHAAVAYLRSELAAT
jgi:hypothetical protein